MIAAWCRRITQAQAPVARAMAYALGSPGKRLRPVLVLAVYRELGGRGDAAELAAAVEVVHSYSLVHDDLPCMDDDDLRRGRLTTHRKYDVPTATEAGYRMVPLAAQVLSAGAERLALPAARLGAIARELFGAAGASGMIGGQVLDLEAEGRALDMAALIRMHAAKTGALMAASGVIGALAAGADEDVVAGVRRFGEEIGLAFQITDDLLDITSTSAELGKTAGKDQRRGKATFATVMSSRQAEAEACRRLSQAVDHLKGVGVHSTLLEALAHFMVHRTS